MHETCHEITIGNARFETPFLQVPNCSFELELYDPNQEIEKGQRCRTGQYIRRMEVQRITRLADGWVRVVIKQN